MDPALGICRFGPCRFDLERRRLFRGQERVWLPDRSMDVLRVLVANAGRIISMDGLTTAVWTEFAVCDNSIVKAVSVLRRELGRQKGGAPYIETLIRKGYRFVAAGW